jgi:hypothetical protein
MAQIRRVIGLYVTKKTANVYAHSQSIAVEEVFTGSNMMCPDCTLKVEAERCCTGDNVDDSSDMDSIADTDDTDDATDDGMEVVKDLDYWKSEATKSERVSMLLCEWYRTKCVALDALTSSSGEKLRFLENELVRQKASSSEKAVLVANERSRERTMQTHQTMDSENAYNAVVREGKRARETITGLQMEVGQLEAEAVDLAAYHEQYSVRKRKR